MDRTVLDVIQREIDDEAKIRFPGGAVSRVRILEFTFDVPVNRDGHCPRMSRGVAQKLSDYRREKIGEDIFELTRLGAAALETVDTLILAGIADTRGDAIRRALDRVRAQPAYERLRRHVLDTRRLVDEWVAGA